MSILCTLAKIKEIRGNAKTKIILRDVDLTSDGLQNEDYLYTQPSNHKLDLVCLIMDLQRKQRELSLINEENT